jgi:hypothetical protein
MIEMLVEASLTIRCNVPVRLSAPARAKNESDYETV